MTRHRLWWGLTGGIMGCVLLTAGYAWWMKPTGQTEDVIGPVPQSFEESGIEKETAPEVINEPAEIVFVGPRENIPTEAPAAYGFWSFSIPVSDVLSRSGQPLIGEFKWMAKSGWRGVVNLRVDGERDEVGDDAKLPGFNQLGLNYLHLPIVDGHPPTDEQAEKFLKFVTDPNNQPTHVHCRGGIGRAGTMVALYRYAVQGWPMDQAIAESRAFKGGVSSLQEVWLERYAQTNRAGGYLTGVKN